MGQGGGCLKPLEQKKVKGKKNSWIGGEICHSFTMKTKCRIKKNSPNTSDFLTQDAAQTSRAEHLTSQQAAGYCSPDLFYWSLLILAKCQVYFTLQTDTHTHTHRLNSHRCVWFFSQILFACEHSVSSSSNYDGYPSFSTEVSLTARPRNHPSILLFW